VVLDPVNDEEPHLLLDDGGDLLDELVGVALELVELFAAPKDLHNRSPGQVRLVL